MKFHIIAAMLIMANCSFHTTIAVAAITGKASIAPGRLDSQGATNIEGSITVPVSNGFHFQADGLYTDVDNNNFQGIVGRGFWQDKDKAYLGIEIGGIYSEFVDSYELSFEGEYYFQGITIGGKTGMASIKYDREVPFIETDEQQFFGTLYVNVYPLDNLMLATSIENRFSNSSLGIEAEYGLPIKGMSVFASAMGAEHGYNQGFLGIRYYLGGADNLKELHRSAAPQATMSKILSGIGTYGAEYNKAGKRFLETYNFVLNPLNLNTNENFNNFGSVITMVNITQEDINENFNNFDSVITMVDFTQEDILIETPPEEPTGSSQE